MRSLTFLFIVILGFSAEALPLFRVEKDGKVNWLWGTLHFPLKDGRFSSSVLEPLSGLRLIMTETGTPENRRRLKLSHQERLPDTPRRERDIKRILSTLDYLKFKRIVGDRLNLQMLDFVPGSALPQVLDDLFTKALLYAVEDRLKQLSGWESELKESIARDGYEMSPPNPDTTGWTRLDDWIADFGVARSIPVVALDTEEYVSESLSTDVRDGDLRQYILTHLRRLDAVKTLPGEELVEIARLAITNFNGNTWTRYLRWAPGQTEAIQGLPVTRSLPAPPPLLGPLAKGIRRHNHWLSAIETEFSHGGTLVAVGEGHVIETRRLSGQQSLVALLIARGYKVVFVGSPCAQWLGAGGS